MSAVKLTENQADVLATLARCRDRLCSRELDGQQWATPQDVGGQDGSHHSSTLTALAKKGLADRYKLGNRNKATGERVFNRFNSKAKGSCCYRITDAGLAWLAEQEKPA